MARCPKPEERRPSEESNSFFPPASFQLAVPDSDVLSFPTSDLVACCPGEQLGRDSASFPLIAGMRMPLAARSKRLKRVRPQAGAPCPSVVCQPLAKGFWHIGRHPRLEGPREIPSELFSGTAIRKFAVMETMLLLFGCFIRRCRHPSLAVCALRIHTLRTAFPFALRFEAKPCTFCYSG